MARRLLTPGASSPISIALVQRLHLAICSGARSCRLDRLG
jgi:hypothetical protein